VAKFIETRALLAVIFCSLLSLCCSQVSRAQDAAADLKIQVPQSGPMSQRVKQLWQTTRPIIEADARGNLSEARYQARRTPLFSAWVRLQGDNSISSGPSEAASRVIPRILELINHVYGFPGYPEAKRVAERRNAGRTAYLIKDINRRLAKLP
jgi:hypothetical protein